MADLQCLICDWTVPKTEDTENELLDLLGVGSVDAGKALIAHMSEHTLAEWIRSFKMADRYIEQLETELEEAKRAPAFTDNSYQVRADPGPAPGAGFEPTQAFTGPPGGGHFPSEDDPELLRRYTPREIAAMRRRRQIQAEIESHNPDETLIPRIPDAQRPEGVVGVKY